jgi:hypothetical protein
MGIAMQYELWFVPLRVWVEREKIQSGVDAIFAKQLEAAGFIEVNQQSGTWDRVHKWLKSQDPERFHYTWTGSRFWFSNEELAHDFELRYG